MREVALLTSAGGDGLATVVDALTGTQITSLKNCSSQPGSTALIAGDFIVSAQVKGTAMHFWAWGAEQPRLKCHAPEKLGPLAVSDDGWLCAGGGLSGRVYLWEVSSGALLHAWDAHYKAVSALAFSPDGCFLYSGGEDAMVSAWNMLAAVDPEGGDAFKGGVGDRGSSGRHSSFPTTWTASQHSLPVTCVMAAIGGGRVYTCSLDRTARVWDAASGRLLLSATCPTFLRAVTADPAETFLFAAGGGGVIYQLDISATAIAATASDAALASTSSSTIAGRLSSSGLEGDDYDTSWGLSLPGYRSGVGGGGGGGRSGGGGGDGGGAGGGLQELHGHEKTVTSLSVTADSSVLVSGSEDGTARSWHVASRQCLQKTETVGKGTVSQVILLPLPDALAAVRTGSGRKRHAVPLSPFDKFMRTANKIKPGASVGGYDFSAGCTPVILQGVHRPRGRLAGAISEGTGDAMAAEAAAGGGWGMVGGGGDEGPRGIRAALESLEGRAAGGRRGLEAGVAGEDEGKRGRNRGEVGEGGVGGEEGGEGGGGGGANKVARLEGEIERLRTENLRWQKVNNALYQKLGADGGGGGKGRAKR